MRQLKSLLALIIALLIATIGLGAPPAHAAYPTSPFSFTGPDGYTEGGLIWYNQSVGVQGSVCDYHNDSLSSTVTFVFWAGGTWVGSQERSITDNCRDFNFSQDGPAGGITKVEIWICSPIECGNIVEKRAATHTQFDLHGGLPGHARASLAWYNRSVGIQGEVCAGPDAVGPTFSTTVFFTFFQDNVALSSQSRTVDEGCRSFNFIQEGPTGGINKIAIYVMINNDFASGFHTDEYKP